MRMVTRSIEKPTLIERFVSLVPVPYPVAALFWPATFLGPPGELTIQYLTTGRPSLPDIPGALLHFLLLFYLLLTVRYIRLRVVAAEGQIAARLIGGEQDYHRAFGRMTQTAPVLVLTAVLGTFLVVFSASLGDLPTAPGLIAFEIVIAYFESLAFSTYLWEFATASLGLHKLGGSSLRLESFLEDRMMGSKPMGSLALSLTTAYYGALLLAVLLFSTFSTSTVFSTPVFTTFLLLGVALFFLPLNSVHGRMQAEKRRLLREITARYPRLTQDTSMRGDNATLDDVNTRLARLTDLQEVEMLDRRIAALPTWPFDIQLASKFITIVLSVTGVLLSRLIASFLHI